MSDADTAANDDDDNGVMSADDDIVSCIAVNSLSTSIEVSTSNVLADCDDYTNSPTHDRP